MNHNKNFNTKRTIMFTFSHSCRDILTYLDEIEQCCDATLESAKNELQKVQDSTRETELKMVSMPKLVTSQIDN